MNMECEVICYRTTTYPTNISCYKCKDRTRYSLCKGLQFTHNWKTKHLHERILIPRSSALVYPPSHRHTFYLRYLCLFAHSGLQHIFSCVFVLFVFDLCLVPNVASFSGLPTFDCPLVLSNVY